MFGEMKSANIKFETEMFVNLVDSMGDDLSIVKAARVSTASEAVDNYEKLIDYLLRYRHGTPFEHTSMTFKISAPIFVWREFHRHRIGFSYNEQSARYTVLEPIFYLPSNHRPAIKTENWIPARPKFLEGGLDEIQNTKDDLVTVYTLAYRTYEKLIANNMDPGLARVCLPVGIYSTCFVTCNARSLMNFLSLRVHDPDALFISYPLYEIEQVALKMEQFFSELFPVTYASFIKNRRVAP